MNNAKARRQAERANRFADHVSEKIESSQGQEWDSSAKDEAKSPSVKPEVGKSDKSVEGSVDEKK